MSLSVRKHCEKRYNKLNNGLTKVVNSRVQVGVTVLSIHVVSARSRVVLDPDAVVLDVSVVLFGNLSEEIELEKNHNYENS